ncbi:hypothetical protein [Rhodospirillum rubrum]|uniref:Uncharacterized protein n=1 Tax=Rhodospirillum rubrum (strain ATCC 11170 / ATH 1.1.1 / DSM 467 / LMG 4362 / NCIMB 8255 / S1) TaxID=269796 RepID=Q2RRB8_RHORT|nr:hypothetical protein [Rhodospirillum rubrum]ABC23327.1 hypothetical protein Rru_A2527 [Rhodospirillum rubrum ATCC 11170]AEO49060.1 hypothetical protein F11_12980 [Rhodospirillum rubrum F11]MBK5954970.1 hypothetical protein [Rhodospirillum rubrum]QXG79300.1 hypothetical protein KUL73_13045 [Rhodospirillum rubrum]HAQ01279.1 hypothetical protein [Rhodospirillum rubrum]
MGTTLPALRWDVDIAFLGRRSLIGGLSRVAILVWLVLAFVTTMALGVQGKWAGLPPLLAALAAVVCAPVVAGLVAALLPRGDRLRLRFTLTERGLMRETLDQAPPATGRLLRWLTQMSGRPASAGPGLLVADQPHQTLPWKRVDGLAVDPANRTLVLRGGRRTLGVIFCTPETFDAACAWVRARVHENARPRPPLPLLGAWTAVFAALHLPIFAITPQAGVELFSPVLLLLVTLAGLWVRAPLCGWMLVGGAPALAVAIVLGIFEKRHDLVGALAQTRTYETFVTHDWVMLGLSMAALAVVTTLGWLIAHGRAPLGRKAEG